MVTTYDRRLWMVTLLFSVVCCLFVSVNGAVSGAVNLTDPTVLPYTCSTGTALQSCGDQQLCYNKRCARDSRCIENYCGSCQAMCATILSPSNSCGKRFAPVCGRDGKTYASICHARRAGVKLAAKAPCKRADNSCTCDLEYAPVCGSDKQYYINRCVAQLCAAVKTAPEDNCAPQEGVGCICPFIYMPVCGVNNVTYSNSCAAACAHEPVAYTGACGTCKTAQQGCLLAGKECCPGLECAQPGPVDQANATTGLCRDPSDNHPIG